MSAVATRAEQSPLLRALLHVAPRLGSRLRCAEAWKGFRVEDTYERVVAVDDVVLGGSRLLVGLHAFPSMSAEGALHDHRWPLAVLPLSADGAELLYEMPWAAPDGSAGLLEVRAGQPYALDDCRVRHAIRSHAAHLSLNLTDITHPPSRENRLRVEPLPRARVDEIRLRLARALSPASGAASFASKT